MKERKPLNCVWLFATPFLAHGIFQAWILEWVVISFSRVSSQPRYQTQVSHTCRQILYRLSHQGNLEDNTGFACRPQFTSGIFLCSTQHWTHALNTHTWDKLNLSMKDRSLEQKLSMKNRSLEQKLSMKEVVQTGCSLCGSAITIQCILNLGFSRSWDNSKEIQAQCFFRKSWAAAKIDGSEERISTQNVFQTPKVLS